MGLDTGCEWGGVVTGEVVGQEDVLGAVQHLQTHLELVQTALVQHLLEGQQDGLQVEAAVALLPPLETQLVVVGQGQTPLLAGVAVQQEQQLVAGVELLQQVGQVPDSALDVQTVLVGLTRQPDRQTQVPLGLVQHVPGGQQVPAQQGGGGRLHSRVLLSQAYLGHYQVSTVDLLQEGEELQLGQVAGTVLLGGTGGDYLAMHWLVFVEVLFIGRDVGQVHRQIPVPLVVKQEELDQQLVKWVIRIQLAHLGHQYSE